MASLTTTRNLSEPDDFYACLLDAHRDLTTAQSHAMNAALVLLLANHIGDLDVILQALSHARQAVSESAEAPS